MSLIAICLVAWSGGYGRAQVSNAPVRVFVSIPPQQYWVERIAGDRVVARTLVQPGRSPHTYEPTPRQMAALSESSLLFRIGVSFEQGLIPKLRGSMPDLRIVDTSQGIARRTLKGHAHHEHSDGHDARAEHAACADGRGTDPHTWLDPRLAAVQARTIAEALADVDPDHAAGYRENLNTLLGDLAALDQELRERMAPLQGRTLMVFHPSWGYFADAYGLEQEAIEIAGKRPSARQLARIIDRAKQETVAAIFVQPQFDRKSARAVADAVGAAVMPIDPLAYDYIENLRRVAEAIEEALTP